MIASHRVRSLLSMLGVLIGVGCVIAMLALGRGAQQAINEELSRFGSNMLSIRPGSIRVGGVALEQGTVTRMTMEDSNAIATELTQIARVAPQVSAQVQLVYGNKNWSTRVLGTTPEYVQMCSQQPVEGRFFSKQENETRRRVVVLGRTVLRELFGSQVAVGELIKIDVQVTESRYLELV